MSYCIEIATTDFATTQSAVAGGADRIELCSALSEGGITPSFGLIKQCRAAFDVPLFPIIRTRAGDFLYSEEEFNIMLQDVIQCRQIGCDGVVIGMLLADGNIDLERTSRLVKAAYPMEVTFHRAFDRCKDPFKALDQLVSIGCQRILTSGQQPTALAGTELIAQLVQYADDRIIIMPGSGVRKENIREIAAKTGAKEFHSSAKSERQSDMTFIHPSFNETTITAIHAADVTALKNELS